jgi:hypothetical protein
MFHLIFDNSWTRPYLPLDISAGFDALKSAFFATSDYRGCELEVDGPKVSKQNVLVTQTLWKKGGGTEDPVTNAHEVWLLGRDFKLGCMPGHSDKKRYYVQRSESVLDRALLFVRGLGPISFENTTGKLVTSFSYTGPNSTGQLTQTWCAVLLERRQNIFLEPWTSIPDMDGKLQTYKGHLRLEYQGRGCIAGEEAWFADSETMKYSELRISLE